MEDANRIIDWIIISLIFGGVLWWRTRSSTKPTSHDWAGLVRKPDEALDVEQIIIRRTRSAYNAERNRRHAERLENQKVLEADKKKITRANEFVQSSLLDVALTFVWKKTQYWADSSRYENGWKAPTKISGLDGSTKGPINKGRWIEFKPDGSSLYLIELDEPQSHGIDYGWFNSSMTLSVDGERVFSISVTTDQASEWALWAFSDVTFLKVGPWVEGFIGFYTRLLSIEERESDDRHAAYVREQAAKFDLGGLDGKR